MTTRRTSPNFCACCLWPWLGPPLTALRYVMYFRFCGWHHIFTPWDQWARIKHAVGLCLEEVRQVEVPVGRQHNYFFVEFVGIWRIWHLGEVWYLWLTSCAVFCQEYKRIATQYTVFHSLLLHTTAIALKLLWLISDITTLAAYIAVSASVYGVCLSCTRMPVCLSRVTSSLKIAHA